MKTQLFFVFAASFLYLSATSASSLTYIGKCSWDYPNVEEGTYRANLPLAEFYLDSDTNVVFVKNEIDTVGGSFFSRPLMTPSEEVLQVAGEKGVNIYSWDNGESRINFTGQSINTIGFSTDSVNALLDRQINIYAPCVFIQ